MCFYDFEMSVLLLRIVFIWNFDLFDVLVLPRFFAFKFCIKLKWIDTARAYVGHVHCFVVGVSSKLVFLILVVEIGNVVVTDTQSLVIWPTE